MKKIDNTNYLFNYDPQVKKKKSKKSEKSRVKSSITLENSNNFEKILYATEIDLEAQAIEAQKIKLENLLKQIGKQGEKLKKSKHLEDLDVYKKNIKEYLLIFLSLAEKTEKKTTWNKFKKEKTVKIHLEIIDEELLELTKIFFTEQHNTLAIAAKIDKIEGLLVDLRL